MSQSVGWVGGVVAVALAAAGCFSQPQDTADQPKMTEFATGAGGQGEPAGVKFDGERALKYLKQVCNIGPRISGSEGMKKQQELLEKHFKDLGATVTRQEFKARQASRKEATAFTNLIVSWHPEREKRVLFCAHYDTRPIADQEPDRNSWTRPFLSANDGTGGAALFMELASRNGMN